MTVKEAAVILQNLKRIGARVGLMKDGTLVVVNRYEYRIYTFEKIIDYIIASLEEYDYGIEEDYLERKTHANIEILTRIAFRCGKQKVIPLDKMSLKELCELLQSLPDGYHYESFFFTPILKIDTDCKSIEIFHEPPKDYSITCL